MSWLGAFLDLLWGGRKAAEADERDRIAREDLKRAGRTAGDVARDAEKRSADLRRRTGGEDDAA